MSEFEKLRERLTGYELSDQERLFFQESKNMTMNRVMLGGLGGAVVAYTALRLTRVSSPLFRVTTYVAFSASGSFIGWRSGVRETFDSLLHLKDSPVADQARIIILEKYPDKTFPWAHLVKDRSLSSAASAASFELKGEADHGGGRREGYDDGSDTTRGMMRGGHDNNSTEFSTASHLAESPVSPSSWRTMEDGTGRGGGGGGRARRGGAHGEEGEGSMAWGVDESQSRLLPARQGQATASPHSSPSSHRVVSDEDDTAQGERTRYSSPSPTVTPRRGERKPPHNEGSSYTETTTFNNYNDNDDSPDPFPHSSPSPPPPQRPRIRDRFTHVSPGVRLTEEQVGARRRDDQGTSSPSTSRVNSYYELRNRRLAQEPQDES